MKESWSAHASPCFLTTHSFVMAPAKPQHASLSHAHTHNWIGASTQSHANTVSLARQARTWYSCKRGKQNRRVIMGECAFISKCSRRRHTSLRLFASACALLFFMTRPVHLLFLLASSCPASASITSSTTFLLSPSPCRRAATTRQIMWPLASRPLSAGTRRSHRRRPTHTASARTRPAA